MQVDDYRLVNLGKCNAIAGAMLMDEGQKVKFALPTSVLQGKSKVVCTPCLVQYALCSLACICAFAKCRHICTFRVLTV